MTERKPRLSTRRKADRVAADAKHLIKLSVQVLTIVATAVVTGIGLLVLVVSTWKDFIKGLM